MTETEKPNPFGGLTTAVRLLTILPFPGREASRFADCHPWMPVVGGLLGGLLILVGRSADWATDGWHSMVAVVIVAASAILTRGFHLDGFSDCADGFGGGFTRERRLEIMKDSRVGAFGAIALTLLLIGKVLALQRIVALDGWAWVLAAGVLSRAMLVVLSGLQPYARPKGGTGKDFVTQWCKRHTAIAILICFALLLLPSITKAFPLLLLSTLILTFLFGLWCRKMVGGITGDLLGACCEGTELWVLLYGGVYLA